MGEMLIKEKTCAEAAGGIVVLAQFEIKKYPGLALLEVGWAAVKC